MRKLAFVAVVLLLVSSLPASQARHLSVGWSDHVGVEPEESVEDPTVSEQDYQIGTSKACYEPNASNRSVGEVQEALASDGFCGELVYGNGTGFEQVADRDQQLNGPIGSFDVVRAGRPLLGSESCYPWCSWNPVGAAAYGAFHQVGEDLELTDSPDEAEKRDSENRQYYAVSPAYPTAGQVVQEQAGAWRMNGWYHPQGPYETFVGFLHDEDGEPIDDERLQELVQDNRDLLSKNRAINPTICGFTPSTYRLGVGSTWLISYKPQSERTWCHVTFEWIEESGNQSNFQDGYNERCKSPTYLCGAVQPAWQATVTCPVVFPCTGSGTTNSDVSHSIWHWIVAPTRSACNGQQVPGLAFDTEAAWDYLAHDLDVWTPVTSLRGQDTEGVANVQDYASALPPSTQEEVLRAAGENYSKVASELDRFVNLPGGIPDVQKGHRIEPNHARDDLALMGLSEDSQSKTWAREAVQNEGSCAALSPDSEETEQYVDPWVNLVNMETVRKRLPLLSTFASSVALYGNSADHQDQVNQPTSGPVYFDGRLGLFADKDDDGWYAYDDTSPVERGSYPLFWGMQVDEEGQVDTDAGCNLEGGTPLSEAMKKAHYGPRTGLMLAVYLEEPTVVYDGSTYESAPFPAGQTIFVHESQSITQLRRNGDPQVIDWIGNVADGLRSHPDIADGAEVVYLNDLFGRASSFQAECREFYKGGFVTELTLVHQCETGCAGDTIVTGYMVESTHPDLQIGSGEGTIPPLEFDSGEVFELDQRVETWLDVDPFDGDPERNRKNSSAPPQ